jgi:spore germination protein GerM
VNSASRAAAAVALLVTCACGIPAEQSANRIDDESVPFGLLSSAPPGSPSADTGRRALSVYFVRDDRLVAVERRVDGAPDAAQALSMLVNGPTQEEQDADIGTNTADLPLAVAPSQRPGVVTVDLARRVTELPSRVQTVALGQIVYTLAELPGVDAVAFTVDGEPVDVLRGDGSLSGDPVSPADYPELAPDGRSAGATRS